MPAWASFLASIGVVDRLRHLSSAYRKLALGSRRELAAALAVGTGDRREGVP
jgi:hypothetical protein